MKNVFYVLLALMTIVSCKDETTENQAETEPYIEEEVEVAPPAYPENLTQVFEAHGGIEQWNEMETLEFSVEHSDGYEITTTDLKDRYALIEMPQHTIGFDGETLWVKNRGKSKYEGDAQLYYDKMFQYYAMPFILADDGSLYAEAESLTFEGKTYPGIHISYETVTNSNSDEEYTVYYDADTYKMTWLAYTETHAEKEPSASWHFINYSNWQAVEGLLLPKTMVWYSSENMQPKTLEKKVEFVSPMLTTVKMDARVYSQPEGAEALIQ